MTARSLPRRRRLIVVGAIAAVSSASALVGCGSDADTASDDGTVTIVVTTDILGDITGQLVGPAAEVVTIMPPGTDPHDFEPSARDVQAIESADLLVINGGGFEHGLEDVVEAATESGVRTFTALDHVETLELPDAAQSEAEAIDPHFFTDPVRMIDVVEALADELGEIDDLAAWSADGAERTDVIVADLRSLDTEVEQILAAIPDDRRQLVTGHESMQYFADRYGLRIVGAVIPSGGGGDGVSASDMNQLVTDVTDSGAAAVFIDITSSSAVAEAVAEEAGVPVVGLYTESLGQPDSTSATYVGMIRTDAQLIAETLR